MPPMDHRILLNNLGAENLEKPTTMILVQNKLHELDKPIGATALAVMLGLGRVPVSMALIRLVKKGLAVRRWSKRTSVLLRTGRSTKNGRPFAVRRSGRRWLYEILQEK